MIWILTHLDHSFHRSSSNSVHKRYGRLGHGQGRGYSMAWSGLHCSCRAPCPIPLLVPSVHTAEFVRLQKLISFPPAITRLRQHGWIERWYVFRGTHNYHCDSRLAMLCRDMCLGEHTFPGETHITVTPCTSTRVNFSSLACTHIHCTAL